MLQDLLRFFFSSSPSICPSPFLSRLLLLMTLMMLCALAFRTTQPTSAWNRRKLSLIKHQRGAKTREHQLALILLTWLFAQIIRKSSAIEYYAVYGIHFRTWVYSYSYSFSYLLLCFYLCFVFVQLLRLVNIEVYSHTHPPIVALLTHTRLPLTSYRWNLTWPPTVLHVVVLTPSFWNLPIHPPLHSLKST